MQRVKQAEMFSMSRILAALAVTGVLAVGTPAWASTHEDGPMLQQKAIVVEAPAHDLEKHVDEAVQKLASESWRVVSVTPVPAAAVQEPAPAKKARTMYTPKHLAYNRKAKPQAEATVTTATIKVLIVAENESDRQAVID